MGKMLSTGKISDVIKTLEKLKEEYGDVPLVLAKDEEGNAFNTTSIEYDDHLHDFECGVCVLYPASTAYDISDIKGYEDYADEDLDPDEVYDDYYSDD